MMRAEQQLWEQSHKKIKNIMTRIPNVAATATPEPTPYEVASNYKIKPPSL
jgi:hypothetical protein